ncbi:MAG TPA: ribosomal protein L7/L12 [Blastocatellia bacterium]|nr:ribosomal protein L7/L12 [Blastocatellia bacterium]
MARRAPGDAHGQNMIMNFEYLLIACVILLAISAIFNACKPRSEVTRLERKIDLLLKHAGIDPNANIPKEVIHAAQAGDKIKAIRLYREATGASLKEAKELVEGISKT